jgi:hypothetical protein
VPRINDAAMSSTSQALPARAPFPLERVLVAAPSWMSGPAASAACVLDSPAGHAESEAGTPKQRSGPRGISVPGSRPPCQSGGR